MSPARARNSRDVKNIAGFGHDIFKNSLCKKGKQRISMIHTAPLRIDEKTATGLRVDLPDSPPLVMIIGRTGFVMCGFLNVEAAEKLDVTAAMVSGVRNFDDMLKAGVKAVTSRAGSKGIKVGMKGKDAVKLLL